MAVVGRPLPEFNKSLERNAWRAPAGCGLAETSNGHNDRL